MAFLMIIKHYIQFYHQTYGHVYVLEMTSILVLYRQFTMRYNPHKITLSTGGSLMVFDK